MIENGGNMGAPKQHSKNHKFVVFGNLEYETNIFRKNVMEMGIPGYASGMYAFRSMAKWKLTHPHDQNVLWLRLWST